MYFFHDIIFQDSHRNHVFVHLYLNQIPQIQLPNFITTVPIIGYNQFKDIFSILTEVIHKRYNT